MSNALVQMQARYHRCDEVASEKCLGSCISFVDTHCLRRSSFKRKRREIVEARVKACRVVVLHISLQRVIQRTFGWKQGSTGEFGFERMKKRFGVCIVARAPDAGTLQEAELRHLRAKGRSHVLRSSAHDPARVVQELIEAWAAVAFTMQRKEALDLPCEESVLSRMSTLTAPTPGVEAGGRHGVASAERRDVEVRTL